MNSNVREFIANYLKEHTEQLSDMWEAKFWIGQDSQINEFKLELFDIIDDLRKYKIPDDYCKECGHDFCECF